jgi:pyruvate/2-oxoglutarate dehydrogenase complex dihydrolipoamide acyltransferase (E2) component
MLHSIHQNMTKQFHYHNIPPSRIATFDVFTMGLKKHHAIALMEFDVTNTRQHLKERRKNGAKISMNAWLIKAISGALEQHPAAAAFLYNRKKLISFTDINISVLVEKEINGQKVPLPLVIEKTNRKSAVEITAEIEAAKNLSTEQNDIVLGKSSKKHEQLYVRLPRFLRLAVWKFILQNPKIAYKNMGNAVVTSLGMMARLNGWLIHKSIHPVSFGVGAIIQKPVVVNNEIKIREILNMTILIDHDVIDGAPMARFLKCLAQNIEKAD